MVGITEDQFDILYNLFKDVNMTLKSVSSSLKMVSRNEFKDLNEQAALIEAERKRIEHRLKELASSIK